MRYVFVRLADLGEAGCRRVMCALARCPDGSPRDLGPAAVLAGSWLLAAASQLSVPMYPVPMTMQTFAILLVAGLAGARLARPSSSPGWRRRRAGSAVPVGWSRRACAVRATDGGLSRWLRAGRFCLWLAHRAACAARLACNDQRVPCWACADPSLRMGAPVDADRRAGGVEGGVAPFLLGRSRSRCWPSR